MEARTSIDTFPRALELASLSGLTIVLALLAPVFARSGPEIWIVVAFLGISSWLGYAVLRRDMRQHS